MKSVLAGRIEFQSSRWTPLQQRAVGAYLGLAVGDALGATVEFLTPAEIRYKHGVHDSIIGGGWLGLKPGQITDDTTMSLALGQSILEQGKVVDVAVAWAFDNWMRSKPVDIGNTVRRGIIRFRQTGEPAAAPNVFDAGNGACMRTLPVALATWRCPEQLTLFSRAQAHVTHNNPLSDAATECVIQLVHAGLRGESLEAQRQGCVAQLVEAFPQFNFDGKRQDNPSGYIVDTMRAVFQALFDHDFFSGSMVDVVNRGGDADTTGAILGMIAGSYYGVGAIPDRWLKKLNHEVCRACQTQALALLALGSDECHDVE